MMVGKFVLERERERERKVSLSFRLADFSVEDDANYYFFSLQTNQETINQKNVPD